MQNRPRCHLPDDDEVQRIDALHLNRLRIQSRLRSVVMKIWALIGVVGGTCTSNFTSTGFPLNVSATPFDVVRVVPATRGSDTAMTP